VERYLGQPVQQDLPFIVPPRDNAGPR
jgi:hypothetical protein